MLVFHAQWRRERLTELKKDYTILDGVKGKGHYVGTYLAIAALERYTDVFVKKNRIQNVPTVKTTFRWCIIHMIGIIDCVVFSGIKGLSGW